MPLLDARRSAILTPRRSFWIGLALLVVSGIIQSGLVVTLYAIGGQELASTEAAWSTVELSEKLLQPFGAALVVLSFIARWLEPVAAQTGDGAPHPWPRRLSARTAFWAGCALVVVGLVVKTLLPQWVMSTAGSTSTLAYIVAYVMPVLVAVAVPVGVLLIPAAWVLRIIEGQAKAE